VDYRTLGASGCAVSSFCLGTMTFGSETDESGAHRQLDRFVEAGGTFVDTADVYSDGVSEQIIGRWLAGRPAALTEPVVLATKGRFGPDGSPNGAGLSARHLTRALDASLRRLGVDAVDLYQLHAFDPLTPLEETLRTLDGFIRAGKIRYWGLRAAGLRLSAGEVSVLDAASDPEPPDYPYGEMGLDQRDRRLPAGTP
jgi:aryl-alcohol dehydrogenase-like predicted oxidoreductase